MLAVKSRLQRAEQDVVHQRALARAGDTGDGGDDAERNPEIDVLEIVLACAGEREPAWADATTFKRHGDGFRAGEILSGERTLARAGQWPGEDDTSAALAAPRPELHHEVRRANRLQVVLHDEHGVAGLAETRQQSQQPRHVARMEADGRLIEDIKGVHELRAERVGESDALRFTTGERARRSIEREIIEAHVAEELYAVARFLEHVGRDATLERSKRQLIEPRH